MDVSEVKPCQRQPTLQKWTRCHIAQGNYGRAAPKNAKRHLIQSVLATFYVASV
jgi:hypothetical protein